MGLLSGLLILLALVLIFNYFINKTFKEELKEFDK